MLSTFYKIISLLFIISSSALLIIGCIINITEMILGGVIGLLGSIIFLISILIYFSNSNNIVKIHDNMEYNNNPLNIRLET